MIPMDIIVFVVSLLTGLHFTTGVDIQRTRFVNNTLQVDWSGDGDSYYITVTCIDNPVRNNRFLNSPCTNRPVRTAEHFTCRVEWTSFTVQNALDCQSYTIIVDELTDSRPKDTTSFQTPHVIYTTVGSSVNLSWSSPGLTRFGYSIKNMDNDHLYMYIRLSGRNKDVKDNSTDFLGDPANLTNVTRIRIKNTSLTHGGYIVSGFGRTVIYGGIILAVQGKPSKPQIISSTTEVEQGRWRPLTCESIPNTKPDYVDFLQITYTWYVNGTVQKPNNYRAFGENLHITSVTRNDSYNRISCRAAQNTTVSEFSDITKLNVLYGPREAVLSPDNNTTNLDEGQNLGPISCSADCNPTCTIQWRFNATMGHGKFVDQTTQNGVLQIVNVRRSMAGVYRCLLQNKVDYNRKDVSLNVLFPPNKPTVRVGGQIVSTWTEVRNESSELTIHCTTSSYPTSLLTLGRERKELYNRTSNSISYPLENVSCTDSGQYTCLAVNKIGRDERTFNLIIQCRPRVKQNSKSQFAAEINSSLLIGIPVIANPKPSLSWTDAYGMRTTVPSVSLMDLSYDYLITTNMTILSKEQYGNYTVIIKNGLGRISHTINIIEIGKPLPVQSFIKGVVGTNSVNLIWIPGFDGGAKQHFVISHDSPKTSEWIVVVNLTDPGQTQLMSKSVQGLMPNRRYRFRIVSANRFGDTSQTPLYVEFTTKGLPESDPLVSRSMVGVAAGVSALILVVIIGIVVFLAVKKLRKTEDERVYDEVNIDQPSTSGKPIQAQIDISSTPNKGSSKPQVGGVYINGIFQNQNLNPDKSVVRDIDPGTNVIHIYSNQRSATQVKQAMDSGMNLTQLDFGANTQNIEKPDTGGVDPGTDYTQLEFNNSIANSGNKEMNLPESTSNYTELEFNEHESFQNPANPGSREIDSRQNYMQLEFENTTHNQSSDKTDIDSRANYTQLNFMSQKQ